jgi:hypothetical protein
MSVKNGVGRTDTLNPQTVHLPGMGLAAGNPGKASGVQAVALSPLTVF